MGRVQRRSVVFSPQAHLSWLWLPVQSTNCTIITITIPISNTIIANILDPTKPFDQKPSKRCVYCWRNFCPLDFVPHDLIAIYNRSEKVVSFYWDRIYPTIVEMSWASRRWVISWKCTLMMNHMGFVGAVSCCLGGVWGSGFWFGYKWRRWGLGVFLVLIWVEEEVGVAVGGWQMGLWNNRPQLSPPTCRSSVPHPDQRQFIEIKGIQAVWHSILRCSNIDFKYTEASKSLCNAIMHKW